MHFDRMSIPNIIPLYFFLCSAAIATPHIYPHTERHLSESEQPQIPEKMTPPARLKPAAVKKTPLATDKFNQFVAEERAGPDNPRSTMVSSELNVGSTDRILQAVKSSEDVFQRVRIYMELKRKVAGN